MYKSSTRGHKHPINYKQTIKTKYKFKDNMNNLKLFQNHEDYVDFASDLIMAMPNVSHCIQENEVHYNNNIESFRIFKEVFCDNVNETDIERFKNGVVSVNSYIFESSGYKVSIQFLTNNILGKLECDVSPIEITGEQYDEWRNLRGNELLYTILPLFQCQGGAEHTWIKPDQNPR